ncbi:ribosome recycling factor [Liquorilactobacillus sucicola DSM 21376 = JCM 15457]|uniref:Ribosome-recycling factor n=1 Tax=Liquorilactobacillus sucicola DSM 21376 = JCM 15457 TaxID=1423806 RepID=A0A023CUA4_9LACO|nr:ribosome recycling factor [Liquorilactobacillus sucicola]KRN05370.1 ribosome recycling factor [Liquorilactobacillus sucicola DSM 21376 = JCM 15457]GAJ25442.1 ribosome recycling factor [Liquorilactobacillus sucicola DSM 21376 = JCM 15457]
MQINDPIIKQAKEKMTKAEEAFQRELGNVRAGRANASLLNRINVDYYGVSTPLNQIAQISVPEARVLLVTPYDKSSLKDIEHAILASDLGISPANDGSAIRLVIPQLTEERRKELAKEVKAQAENAKVAVRNIRRDMMDELKKAEKKGDLTEDDLHTLEEQAQKVTDNSVKNVETIQAEKEKEILDV